MRAGAGRRARVAGAREGGDRAARPARGRRRRSRCGIRGVAAGCAGGAAPRRTRTPVPGTMEACPRLARSRTRARSARSACPAPRGSTADGTPQPRGRRARTAAGARAASAPGRDLVRAGSRRARRIRLRLRCACRRGAVPTRPRQRAGRSARRGAVPAARGLGARAVHAERSAGARAGHARGARAERRRGCAALGSGCGGVAAGGDGPSIPWAGARQRHRRSPARPASAVRMGRGDASHGDRATTRVERATRRTRPVAAADRTRSRCARGARRGGRARSLRQAQRVRALAARRDGGLSRDRVAALPDPREARHRRGRGRGHARGARADACRGERTVRARAGREDDHRTAARPRVLRGPDHRHARHPHHGGIHRTGDRDGGAATRQPAQASRHLRLARGASSRVRAHRDAEPDGEPHSALAHRGARGQRGDQASHLRDLHAACAGASHGQALHAGPDQVGLRAPREPQRSSARLRAGPMDGRVPRGDLGVGRGAAAA